MTFRQNVYLMKVLLLSLLIIASNPVLSIQIAQAAQLSGVRQYELLHMLKQDCGSCHGLTLKGGLGPALLPANLQGKSIPFLTQTILNGRPGTAMPPWRELLKPDEARWLAEVLLRGENR